MTRPCTSPFETMALPGHRKSYAAGEVRGALAVGGPLLPQLRLVNDLGPGAPAREPPDRRGPGRVAMANSWTDETLTLVDSTAKPTYEPLHIFDEN